MEGAISNTLFQQNAVMLAIDEAHCIHEWLDQVFITLVVLVTCVTLQLHREPTAFNKIGKGTHKSSVYMPECFSSSSNKIKDCKLSRAHKTNFCEESHQQSQYLLLCCKEVEYDCKYDISSLSAPYVQICLLLLQKDLVSCK